MILISNPPPQQEQDVEDDCSNDEEDVPETIKDQTAPQKKCHIHVDVVVKDILPDLPDITTWLKDHSLVVKDKNDQQFNISTIDIPNSECELIPTKIQSKGTHK